MSKVENNYNIMRFMYARSWRPITTHLYWAWAKNSGTDHNKLLPYFAISLVKIQQWASIFSALFLGNRDNLGVFAPFSRSLIIRGIGYRLYPLLGAEAGDEGLGYNYSRYVYLRAGHSFTTYCGVPNMVGLRTLKRERKLVIYGFNDQSVGLFADRIFYYRQPNAFTGRGIRFKKVYYLRKPGKRAQKGRGF